jgi:DNA-binding transcriptional LysR family regulator
VRLDVSDTKRDLFAPGLIAAIRLGGMADPELVSKPLLSVELCIAATPKRAAHAAPDDPAWWVEQTLLCPSAGEAGWALAWRALGVSSSAAPRMLPYASYAAAMEAACAGHGIILAPLPFAQHELTSGRLAILSDVRIASSVSYALILRRSFASLPRGRALARQLLRVCAG